MYIYQFIVLIVKKDKLIYIYDKKNNINYL